MKKVWTILFTYILLFIMSFNFLSVYAKSGFSDVSSTFWGADEIAFLAEKEIIKGYPNGKFGPDDSITRLQAVTMILREMGIGDFSTTVDPGFSDMTANTKGYDIVAKGVELGFINGKKKKSGESYFDPSGTLTRAEMAKILVYAYDLAETSEVTFIDVSSKHWAFSVIQTLVKNRITIGLGNGKFGPSNNMTRAQFATMMARVLDDSFLPAEMKEPRSSYLSVADAKELLDKTGHFFKATDGSEYWYSPFRDSTWGHRISVVFGKDHVYSVAFEGGMYWNWKIAKREDFIGTGLTPEEVEENLEFFSAETKKLETLLKVASEAVYGEDSPKAKTLYNTMLEDSKLKENYWASYKVFK